MPTTEFDVATVTSTTAAVTHAATEYALFDALRFLLASSVTLSHMNVFAWESAGGLAVQVFFALSGWLIGGILYETDARDLGGFYFNRATRIWIPYFFCVAALYLVSYVHESHHSARTLKFLTYDVTFTHNWFALLPDAETALNQMPLGGTGNHFWSLATEEQFYLAAPLLMTLLPFGRKIIFWAGIATLTLFIATGYTAISFGVLAAVALKKFPGAHLSTVAEIALLIVACCSATAMYSGAAFAYAAPIFAISVVLLVARPMPRNGFTRWIGGVSFPFYLNAWMGVFALHAIEKHFQTGESWLAGPLTFGASLAAGAVTYHLIDAPVMANRGRFYNAALGWTLGGVGYGLVATGTALWFFVFRSS